MKAILKNQPVSITADETTDIRDHNILNVVATLRGHVLCLAHVVNLAAELFQHFSDFKHTADLVTMIKSSMFKKPGRKRHYLAYLREFIAISEVKLPPVPVPLVGTHGSRL